MNTCYQAFRRSIERDGPDFSIITNVANEERKQLESDLLQNLDYYETLALGLLKSKRAVPELKRKFTGWRTLKRAACGRALWDIEANPDFLKPIFSFVLKHKKTDILDRISAVGLLTDVNHRDAFDTLERALFDPDYLLRCNAARIYIRNCGRRVDDRTVVRNTREWDEAKLQRFATRLRDKNPHIKAIDS